MKNIALACAIFMLCVVPSLFSQSPLTTNDQNKIIQLTDTLNIFFDRGNRLVPQYIGYDYIRDDYKRQKDELPEDATTLEKALANIDMHLEGYYSYGIHSNKFKMDDLFFTFVKTFFGNYVTLSPFITINGYFDTHIPYEDYDFIRGNIGLYDGGVQAVFLNHLLLSVRGRAVFDVDTTTFMLMPSYVDPTGNPTSYEAPHWYLPQTLNGAGIRVGVIGHHYELAYSQGDFKHSIPKALVFRFNLEHFQVRLLWQHENREDPTDWDPPLFENLLQATAAGVIPFELFKQQFYVNLLGEYTWREGDAQYIRLEQGLEWNVFNIVLRELFHIDDDTSTELFLLEYSVYAKLVAGVSEFSVGFQGSTDGRYYILGKIEF